METRLFNAAQTGNTDLLHQLYAENPLILNVSSLFSTQNPLHIASISGAGAVEFAREILQLNPRFAYELDKDGFSPLHMAAATGCVEIVREIMGIDLNLCRLEGRDKRTPLHLAAARGKTGVIREMVTGCVGCAEDVTIQGETALHLAVKNNQFEAVKGTVELLRVMKKEHMLNAKDERGNSVLHLATQRKQRQVIELFLADRATGLGGLEVNAVNKSGLTALDLLLMFPSEAGDREIEEILRNAGALKANDISLSRAPSFASQVSTETGAAMTQRGQNHEDNLLEYFKFKRGRDSPDDARSALLVVASLVATATFQAGFSPPGGTWQDSYLPSGRNITTNGQKIHKAGWSIMGTYSGVTFTLFVLFTTVGFSVSLSMINILTSHFPLQFELQVCMMALYFAHNTAMTAVAPDSVKLYCILITSIVSGITPGLTILLQKPVRKLVKLVKQAKCRIF